MFKRNITKAEYDAFTGDNAWKQKLYTLNGDGYKLVDVEQDTTAADNERAAREAAEGQLATLNTTVSNLQAQITTLQAEAKKTSNKGKPHDEIIADLEAQLEAAKGETATVKEGLENRLKDSIKKTVATELANAFTLPNLILPEIMKRLDVDLSQPDPKVIINKDGKASAMSKDDLRKELLANPEYKTIIKASEASGGGAGQNGLPNGGGTAPKALKDMTEQERVALHRENPVEFRRLTAEAQAA